MGCAAERLRTRSTRDPGSIRPPGQGRPATPRTGGAGSPHAAKRRGCVFSPAAGDDLDRRYVRLWRMALLRDHFQPVTSRFVFHGRGCVYLSGSARLAGSPPGVVLRLVGLVGCVGWGGVHLGFRAGCGSGWSGFDTRLRVGLSFTLATQDGALRGWCPGVRVFFENSIVCRCTICKSFGYW